MSISQQENFFLSPDSRPDPFLEELGLSTLSVRLQQRSLVTHWNLAYIEAVNALTFIKLYIRYLTGKGLEQTHNLRFGNNE